MSDWHSAQEGAPPEQREQALLAALPDFIAYAKEHTVAYRRHFAGIDAAAITDRAALAALPVTRKSALIGEQEAAPPFGGYDNFAAIAPRRQYMSPGPIGECDFAVPDYWRTAAALYTVGFRAGMLLHNTFSYHFTPAGMMCDEGALALGGRVFPAGPGNSAQQARAAARFCPDCYAGTPDFLQTILNCAEEEGLRLSSLRRASVTGGYLSPVLRNSYADRGVTVMQWYGSADFGCIAYETVIGQPMVVSEGLLVEIVDPVSGNPCAAGEKGEVLVTNLDRAYPLIRFALGDLSAVVEGISECGRTNMRLAGWLGRCDPAVKIKGMFVHPVQVERVLAALSDVVTNGQLAVAHGDGRDKMTFRCIVKDGIVADAALATRLAGVLENELKLHGEVVFVESLSDELIIDERKENQ